MSLDEYGWEFPALADPDEIEEIISELGDIVIISGDLQRKLKSQSEEIAKLRIEINQLKETIVKITNPKKSWFW